MPVPGSNWGCGQRRKATAPHPKSASCGRESDNTFLPRWTLANYYFRHDDLAKFWFWAKQSAAMVYGDAQPLFLFVRR
jgi:hypothetical protein